MSSMVSSSHVLFRCFLLSFFLVEMVNIDDYQLRNDKNGDLFLPLQFWNCRFILDLSQLVHKGFNQRCLNRKISRTGSLVTCKIVLMTLKDLCTIIAMLEKSFEESFFLHF